MLRLQIPGNAASVPGRASCPSSTHPPPPVYITPSVFYKHLQTSFKLIWMRLNIDAQNIRDGFVCAFLKRLTQKIGRQI